VIDAILDRADALVAYDPDEPSVILGWIVFEALTVHYVYVRGPDTESGVTFRRSGIGSHLLKAAVGIGSFSYTHRTLDSQTITSNWKVSGRVAPIYDLTLLMVPR